jgi:phosphoribosylaminoimidazolecarboxamide formyltransferase/IMP cyclohydrolase
MPARALISVSDKTGLIPLVTFLAKHNVELLSTGGTAAAIRGAGLACKDVSEHTKSPECLDGRVKTLHPKIHGGILAVRGNAQHEQDMLDNDIGVIDITILNLYPFEATVAKGAAFEQGIENIDIGGPSMLRSTAKNHAFTTIVTDPSQYQEVMDTIAASGGTTLAMRKRFAAKAFATSAAYDSQIATYFASQLATDAPVVTKVYQPQYPLKYGCNPQQNPAGILSLQNKDLPFTVLNGKPGYINLLDACGAYQLVKEAKEATGVTCATSFKHCSPAGVGLAVPLTPNECKAYEVTEADAANLTLSALAYVRARNADPMCSFGDFAAISDVVDKDTALYLKKEVSDGIIAAGFTEEALEILKTKKSGNFIVLQATEGYTPPVDEYREVYGMCFMQKRNDVIVSNDHVKDENVCTKRKIDDSVKRDMMLASITLKYTQSNSVGFAKGGQMIGIGAGQQSRVDCVKLAGRKVSTWALRQHPQVLGLQFKEGVKRQDRVNARVRYIEGDFTEEERSRWEQNFDVIPEPLTAESKAEYMAAFNGVVLSSDAFFPFRDNIDHASKYGVDYIVQPGGSVADKVITECADEYNMAMALTGVRLFHH